MVIDAGAMVALSQGKSLLSVGLLALKGTFAKVMQSAF
jgi:glutamate 5-kinase